MTADVPPGPARSAGEGIGTLASLSGRPVVPFAIATKRFITRPPGAPSPSTFPSRRLPSWSAIRCGCRKPTMPKSIETGRHRHRASALDRSHRARLCSGRSTRSLDQARHRQAGAVAQGLPDVDAPGGAARAADPRLAHAARQGRARAAARALRHVERATPAGLPRLVPCGERRRGQCRSAGDRDHRRRASRAAHPAHHRHRHLGQARAHAAAARARCTNMCRSTTRAIVQRFLHHWRPDLAVLVESEIWPNLVLETKARGIPLVLINGRMSTVSFQRWRRRPGMSRPLFCGVRSGARAERGARRALRPARRAAHARRRQSQGRRAAAARRSAGHSAGSTRRCRAARVLARRQHASGRGRDHRRGASRA